VLYRFVTGSSFLVFDGVVPSGSFGALIPDARRRRAIPLAQ
jgi:hypothetical protein